MIIADNVKRVRAEIAEAAAKSGRGPKDITLVAAAKQNAAESVREAVLAGVDAVGENRAQELAEKSSQGAYEGAPVHFIGHLQTNKVGAVVGRCSLIESVDSLRLLESVSRRARLLGIRQDVLLEVNIGGESSKSGVLPGELDPLLEFAAAESGLRVLGLMAIPPVFAPNGSSRYFFDEMYRLFVDMRGKKYDNVDMRLLSMGMSSSFIDAIHSGSNMVRVGTAIFGGRA
ncbi:MAG: YggS family pyridoxal phosphate-dependent enzyme [Oscillospiraceae bacterium]|jgi:pyridoxal phosphate enzyme (YggS family)|nr:YggS family pyridoxal phosphate-dependent enzyme [Oscillospiraceae bacterium]